MKWKEFYVLMGAVLVTLSVASPGAAQSVTQGQQPGRVYDRPDRIKVSRIDPKEAYTEWRRIGRRKKGIPCPSVQGWNVKPLFEERYGVKPRNRTLLSRRGLDRYCVYTAVTNPPARFRKPPGLEAVERDRMALAASGNLDHKVAPGMAEKFLEQAGANFSSMQLKAGSPTVRLTFIDSQPTQEGISQSSPPEGSAHGYTLMRLADKLVCTAPNRCAATIASRRALNYDQFEPPVPAASDKGGHIGLISDLAVAIAEEVKLWVGKGRPGHLILNVSLGWDGEDQGFNLKEPAVRTVYEALQLAADNDVLVIAAAGNRRGGPQPSEWPLLPAAWEIGHSSLWPFVLGPQRVYSVGGVDWQGVPLTNSRQGGFPRRVAYGDHAVASIPTLVGETYTPIYTGTSVSAAVVSSAAAMIWHLRPDLGPGEVMELIDDSGDLLEARADFYAWRDLSPLPPAPEAKRVSVCAAVKHACGDNGCLSSLEKPRACPVWDRQPPPLDHLFPDANSVPKSFTAVSLPSPPCHTPAQVMTENGVLFENPCPTDQFGSATGQRWVFPQPPEDPCPGCVMFPPPPGYMPEGMKYYNLRVEINGNWKGYPLGNATLQSATLDIDRFVGGVFSKRLTYSIPFDTNTNSPAVTEMTGLGDGASLFGCRAQINFVVELPDGSLVSLQNPVIVDP